MKPYLIITLSIFVLLTGCVALEQDVVTLEERLMAVEFKNQELQEQNTTLKKQLRGEINTLGKTRQSNERSIRTQTAGINANLEAMQQELRLLKGRVEEMEHLIKIKVTKNTASIDKNNERFNEMGLKAAKVNKRLTELERYLNVEAKNSTSSKTTTTAGKGTKAKTLTAKEYYEQARQAYDNGQLDKARQVFQKLIQSSPKSEYADNAQFWIGESYYREKWYERAILEYQKVIEKYPKGNKVPVAMLKQGMALAQIGEKSSARLIFEKLIKDYPKASEAKIAAKKLKEL